MTFNSLGEAVYGLTGVSIEGSEPAALSGFVIQLPAWIADTEIVYVDGTGGTWELHRLTLPASISVEAADGANAVFAGNGNWAKWLFGVGTETNVGGLGPFANGYPATMSPAGELVLIRDYATLSGLSVYDVTGVEIFNDTTDLSETITLTSGFVYLRDSILSYKDSTGWHLLNISTLATPTWFPRVDAVTQTVPVTHEGTLFLVENASTVTIRRADMSVGWQLNATPLFGIDGVSVDPTLIKAGGCTNLQETADSLISFEIDATNSASLVIRRGTVVGGAVVYGSDTTVEPEDLPTTGIPAGGATLGSTAPIPIVGQATVDLKSGQMTREWRMAWNAMQQAISQVGSVVANTPVPSGGGGGGIPVPGVAGFTQVATSGQPPLSASSSPTLTFTSTDASVTYTTNPVTNAIDLSVAGGFCYIPMTTGAIPGEILFIGAEVMLTKVPVI